MSTRGILLVVPDLMFGPRIVSTAKQLGIEIEESTAERALASWQASDAELAIIDLHGSGEPVELIREMKRVAPKRRVLAFCRHTASDLIRSAREAGADQVLPRSAFFPNLATILETGELHA